MKKIKRWILTLIILLVVVPVTWLLIIHLEGEKPVIRESIPEFLGRAQTLSFSISDEKSGLKNVLVALIKGDKEVVFYQKEFPGAGLLTSGDVKTTTLKLDIEPRKHGISDGQAILRIVADDCSWRRWWHGNRVYLEKQITIDTDPPGIEVLPRFHNINQGGAAVTIYRVSEPVEETGVKVGDNFFPAYGGYFHDPDLYICFFALGYDQGPKSDLYVIASDKAGNKAHGGFYAHLKKKVFKKDTLRISDGFLRRKMPEFDDQAQPDMSPSHGLAKFLEVNRQLREDNYKAIVSITKKSDPRIYWEGTFLRLPNSARKAGFADHRKYVYNGKIIDEQVHLGVDLASVAKSPIPASNTGKVIFNDYLGIYGKTVVIDHGFGLMSMYSHMSSIDVENGQMVTKGDIIGKTGTTGLAGGDHLHFSILIYNTFVNPIEWWDGNWIMHNITDKLNRFREKGHSS